MRRLLTAAAVIVLTPIVWVLARWDDLVISDPADDVWKDYDRG